MDLDAIRTILRLLPELRGFRCDIEETHAQIKRKTSRTHYFVWGRKYLQTYRIS